VSILAARAGSGGNYERAWECPVVVVGDPNFRHRRTAVYTPFLALQVGLLKNGEILERRKFSKYSSWIRWRFGLGGRHCEQPVRHSAAPI